MKRSGRTMVMTVLAGFGLAARGEPVTLVRDGRPLAVICAPADVMEADRTLPPKSAAAVRDAEAQRQRLRESVRDLAVCFRKMSGAELEILTNALPAGDKRVPIRIGQTAVAALGPVTRTAPWKQGFRLVAGPAGVALYGESDLASSYAVYELLHRLGCRWFMPSELGECLPALPTIALEPVNFAGVPATEYRGIWYADAAYMRRNRCGGMRLSAGHALEGYITPEQRQEHPDWQAVINDKPSRNRLKWSNPDVANAIADVLIRRQDADPADSLSLSPDDGDRFDESAADKAIDAGDLDPIFNGPSITDRLMVLCNRVAARVTAKYPDVLFGMLAYVQYTRPPVREKVHPSIVPQIAPITYSRAHPMTDDNAPGNADLRALIEGWGKATGPHGSSLYFYGWFLAEPLAPNPMIAKWSTDVPFVFRNNCKYWQPETIPNFETSMHALYLGLRLAWDPGQDPAAIIDELHTRFYGNAAREMAAYWGFIDDVWVKTPEYSGCGFAYLRRWTPETMAKARQKMDEALTACRTILEYRRVKLADDSLRLFELFIKMRTDLAEGRFSSLAGDCTRFRGALMHLAVVYKDQFTFGAAGWTLPDTIDGRYFKAFYEKTYLDAARLANPKEFQILTPKPLRQWKYQADPDKKGEEAGWDKPEFVDKEWKTTDSCVDSWSTLGLHNYFGRVWYRTAVTLPKTAAPSADQRVFLWIGSTDGSAKLFVNGRHVAYVGAKGEAKDEFAGYCQPASFDVTEAVRTNGPNQVTILCTRTDFNELGTGGLLGPATLYTGKPLVVEKPPASAPFQGQ